MAIKYLDINQESDLIPVTEGICNEFNAFMESNFGLNEGTATDYKTIDISDCDGVDITDTISGDFDNWEGIIPDNTIGDITAEFDNFLESSGLLSEGMLKDANIKRHSKSNFGDYEVGSHDIVKIHDTMTRVYDTIHAIEYLKKGYKFGKTKQVKSKIYFSKDKTKYSEDELDSKLKKLRENYTKLKSAYDQAGGDQVYYQALAAQSQRDMAFAQTIMAIS